jgi:hypothetical protein
MHCATAPLTLNTTSLRRPVAEALCVNLFRVQIMITYFVRHSSDLDLSEVTLNQLWTDDYVALHYPHDNYDSFSNGDSTSTNPEDYSGTAKSCLKTFHELAKNGGYVFSVYKNKSGGKIGYVAPYSKVELLSGVWGDKNGCDGREAILKVIKLDGSKNLTAQESISLKSVQPRQGTACRWWKIGSRVKSLYTGVTEHVVGSLTPDLQEVMCMEFLRIDVARKYSLPILKYSLSPVGRTLKDLDIFGITAQNDFISAQVTYHSIGAADWKLEKLNDYSKNNDFTIYFCKCEKPTIINGHIIFPLDLVFEEFCINDKLGKEWFKRVTCA